MSDDTEGLKARLAKVESDLQDAIGAIINLWGAVVSLRPPRMENDDKDLANYLDLISKNLKSIIDRGMERPTNG